MHRWSAGKCKHHHHKGELLIELPIGLRRAMLPQWIKRLASFNVSARIVHRSPSPLHHMTRHEASLKLDRFARQLGYHCVSTNVFDHGLPKSRETLSEHFCATIQEGSYTAVLNALIINHDPGELVRAFAASYNYDIIDVSQPGASAAIKTFCEELRIYAAKCPSA